VFLIYTIEEEEGGNRSCPARGWLDISGRWEKVGKGHRSVNTVQMLVHMYVNRKMTSFETIPGMVGGGDKGE
jgi:hypothetical protein